MNDTKEKADAQAKANAEAAEVYKKAVNSKFTDGKKTAEVREYHPSHNVKGQARQCFLVNFGHANVSFFEPCKEFMERYKPVTPENPEPAPTDNNLPH